MPVTCVCLVCGASFAIKLSVIQKGGGKYWSYACLGQSKKRGFMRTCLMCQREFYVRPSKTNNGHGVYCSSACHYAHAITPFADLFWGHVEKTDGCWLWIGARYSNGYGHLGRRGKSLLSHRVAWELTYGDIPKGQVVLHICDTPACCRPDHLATGTQQANMLDMSIKGRSGSHVHPEKVPRGERSPRAKLTEANVLQIRQMRDSKQYELSQIATFFGVSKSLIEKVVHRKAWKHID